MADVRIVWNDNYLEGDFAFDPDAQDLASDEGLETAVIISLFTDRRANVDDPLPDSRSVDRRGWWGDLASPLVEGDRIGSRLWLLERQSTLGNVPARAKQYVEEALGWMIEDKIATKIEVEVERMGTIGTDILALKIQIYKPDGSVLPLAYELQWQAQALRP